VYATLDIYVSITDWIHTSVSGILVPECIIHPAANSKWLYKNVKLK